MKQFPSIPRLENAPPELLEGGHLWILEKIDGANVRFQLQASGLIRFGDRTWVYDDPDAVPDPYQHAVRHVRERLDRDALRAAVDDVESIVFFGEATHRHAIEYDWDRMPSFLGFDVWSTEANAFRPPDAVEAIFEGIGLQPVNAIERERPAKHFDPASYTVPQSRWYDGPAEGVVIRNKRGGRAKLLHPEFREVDETVSVDTSPETLAANYATDRRFEKLARSLSDRSKPVTFETLYERTLEDVVREEYKQLYHGDESIDMDALSTAVAERTKAFLDERSGGVERTDEG